MSGYRIHGSSFGETAMDSFISPMVIYIYFYGFFVSVLHMSMDV